MDETEGFEEVGGDSGKTLLTDEEKPAYEKKSRELLGRHQHETAL